MSAVRVAYLCSRYPWTSHTFVRREVEALRALGVEVVTHAVRATPDDVLRSEPDRREFATTTALLPASAREVARAHVQAARAGGPAVADVLARAAVRERALSAEAGRQVAYAAEGVLLWRAMRRAGVRHVHVHFANPAADVALRAVELGRAIDGPGTWSLSLTVHGTSDLRDPTPARLADKVRAATFVACISHYARAQVMALVEPDHWDALHVVRCGIDPAGWEGTPPLRPPGARLELVTVGRLSPEKGQALLLDAVAGVAAAGRPVRLRVVGDGPERASLEARAARLVAAHAGLEIELLGALPPVGVRAVLADADAFGLPSLSEGVPVVLMEAMAMRLPVVATRIAGVGELVEDGIGGFVVVPGEVAPVTAAIGALAADPELRRRLGEAGRRRVLEEFTSEPNALRMRALLRAAASRPVAAA